MAVELHIKPEVAPITWREFLTYPMGSIALDGYVAGCTQFDAASRHLNVDHHDSIIPRVVLGSTAQQVDRLIQYGGLCEAFAVDGKFTADVYVNDCDEDVCAAWYLLNHISALPDNWRLNRFLNVAGTLDVTGGIIASHGSDDLLEQLAWVFEPYAQFRLSGDTAHKDPKQYRTVIDEVEARIIQHIADRGKKVPLDMRYSVIGGGEGWSMVEAVGANAKIGMYRAGIRAYVMHQALQNGKHRYTIGKMTEGTPFAVGSIMELLNAAEQCSDDRWGGSSMVGGSPRVGHSRLSPVQVQAIINDFVSHQQMQH